MKKDKYNLKIHGCKILCKFVEEIIIVDDDGTERAPLGCYYDRGREISVLKNINEDYKKRVFVHELIHALLIPKSLDMQEHAIDILAFGLIEFARDNKEIFKEIFNV